MLNSHRWPIKLKEQADVSVEIFIVMIPATEEGASNRSTEKSRIVKR